MAEAKALPLYPVYLYEDGFEPPATGTYYLVAKTGIYLRKQTKAGDALVKVEGIPWLQTPTLEFRLKLPKIPARIVGQALTFFRRVFDQYRSEAYVTLLYSQKLGEYRLWCPKQKVSHGSVNYDRTDQPAYEDRNANDWQMVGTIHSHCDFSAFHSGTDIGDEATFDGVHITLGHVPQKNISVSASVAINDRREKLEPDNCCEGLVRSTGGGHKWMSWDDDKFTLELTEEDAQLLVGDTEVIDNEWMPKVEKETWTWGGKKKGDTVADFNQDQQRFGGGGAGSEDVRPGWWNNFWGRIE